MKSNKIIYAIQHNKTKKIYVGKTENLESRYYNHMCALRSGKHPVEDLQRDFDEFGEDFTLFILGESPDFTNRHEYEWMEKLNTTDRNVGYNYNDTRAISVIDKMRTFRSVKTVDGVPARLE